MAKIRSTEDSAGFFILAVLQLFFVWLIYWWTRRTDKVLKELFLYIEDLRKKLESEGR